MAGSTRNGVIWVIYFPFESYSIRKNNEIKKKKIAAANNAFNTSLRQQSLNHFDISFWEETTASRDKIIINRIQNAQNIICNVWIKWIMYKNY